MLKYTYERKVLKVKKKLGLMIITAMLVSVTFTGCKDSGEQKQTETKTDEKITTSDSNGEDATTDGGKQNITFEDEGVFTKFDQDYTWDDSDTFITLGEGDVAITEPGTYVLSGTLKDGQVSVNVDATEKVKLVLNGVEITCKDKAPIYVINADKVAITLAEGTTNKLTDGGNAATSEYKGCIYAKDDLSINGSGKLIVNGNVKNGIHCNNDLAIMSGTIEVKAVDNGIKAGDSLNIKAPVLNVSANDAIKVSDNDDTTKGTFYMEGGELTLTAKDDGITAAISITITGGKATVGAIDKTTNCDGEENIKEGCLITK